MAKLNMAKLFSAIEALQAQSWFRLAVPDIRAFRMEPWLDFTAAIKV